MRLLPWLAPCLIALSPALACDLGSGDEPEASDNDSDTEKKKKKKAGNKKKASKKKPGAEPTSAPKKLDPSAWKFVRERPMEPQGVDACAYLGGVGMACLNALIEEKDPVKKGYMRLLSDADARMAQDALDSGSPGGVAHAEAAMFCADSGPCKQKNDDGDEMDYGYGCLTKAEAALQQGEQVAAIAAQQRACECDPINAQIPVMGGTLACDGKNKPSNRGKRLTSTRAKRVRACATCDAAAGPAACAAEIEELRSTDAALATYLESTHVPRCQSK